MLNSITSLQFLIAISASLQSTMRSLDCSIIGLKHKHFSEEDAGEVSARNLLFRSNFLVEKIRQEEDQ